jgi:hypothetical protein
MTKEDREHTIWAKTFLEAQTTLFNYRTELTKVYLEHDLGERSYMNTASEESGMEIVRYLEMLAKQYAPEFADFKAKFVIHTWNEHAGPIMLERLLKIGLETEWIPFGTEKK